MLHIPYAYEGGFAVTSSNTASFATRVRALQFGGSGTVRVDLVHGSSFTANVQAGDLLPLSATKVYETGTSASTILALY